MRRRRGRNLISGSRGRGGGLVALGLAVGLLLMPISARAEFAPLYDTRLGENAVWSERPEYFTGGAPADGSPPAARAAGWLTKDEAVATLGAGWHLDREVVWQRTLVPDALEPGYRFSIPITGELADVYADGRPVSPGDFAWRHSWLMIDAAAIGNAEWLVAAVRRPAVLRSFSLFGPAEDHSGALDRFAADREGLPPAAAIEYAHYDPRAESSPAWRTLDSRYDDVDTASTVAWRFTLPTRYSGAGLAIFHPFAWMGVEVTVNGERWYGRGAGFETAAANASHYLRSTTTSVRLPSSAEPMDVDIRIHFQSSYGLRENLDEWDEPIGFGLGVMEELMSDSIASSSVIGRYVGYITQRIVIAVVVLLLGLIRRGRGRRGLILLGFLLASGSLALAGDQLIRFIYRVPLLNLAPWEVTYSLFFLAMFATPVLLLHFHRDSTEVAPSPRQALAGRILAVVAGVCAAYQIAILLIVRDAAEFSTFSIGIVEVLMYAIVYLGAVVLMVIHGRRSRDAAVNGCVVAFAALVIVNLGWQAVAAGAPGLIVQPMTYVTGAGIISLLAFAPLLGIPLIVYRRVEQGLADANVVFRRFVPDEFLTFLGISELSDIRPGQQIETELTVFFCDVRGFTSLAEAMQPARAMRFINSYLELVGPVIRTHGGFVDKYLGDGVMAIFPGDASGACHAALEIVNGVPTVDAEIGATVGIGMHTGPAMLGTIGEHDRLDTTVISDAVNTASRLQALSGAYGTSILAGASTVAKAAPDEAIYARFVDTVRLKGKGVPVVVHQISSAPVDEERSSADALYHQAFEQLAAGDLERARTLITGCLEHDATDPVYRLLAARIRRYREQGLPPDWDGVTKRLVK